MEPDTISDNLRYVADVNQIPIRINLIIKLILGQPYLAAMNPSSISPKLLLQFYKDQTVPKLVNKRTDSVNPIKNSQNKTHNQPHRKQETQKKNLTNSLLNNYFNKPSPTKHSTEQEMHHQQNISFESPSNNLYDSEGQHYQTSINPKKHYDQSFSPPLPYNRNKTQTPFKMHHNKEDEKIIEQLREQNRQLKILSHQLTERLQQLKQTNDELTMRINQLERANEELEREKSYNRNYHNHEKKVRNRVYQQLSFYLQDAVTEFTNKLKSQKMTPIVENRIQNFLQLILNLNDVTVNSNHIRNNTANFDSDSVDATIKDILHKSKQKRNMSGNKNRNRSRSVSPQQKYETVFEKLNNVKSSNQAQQMSIFTENLSPHKSYARKNENMKNLGFSTNQQIENIRVQVSPSPSASRKRTKIFNRSFATGGSEEQRRHSRQRGKVVKNLFPPQRNS